jgi:hypothetical protein
MTHQKIAYANDNKQMKYFKANDNKQMKIVETSAKKVCIAAR